MRISKLLLPVIVLLAGAGLLTMKVDFDKYDWSIRTDNAEWDARAGLQMLQMKDGLYVLGGRTPIDPAINPVPGASTIWGDVWKSQDYGQTWSQILETDDTDHWPARAYFEAVRKGKYMYVLGGQNFNIVPNEDCPPFPSDCPPLIPVSDFFDDVWRSTDGVDWVQMTDSAGWTGRAGLSAAVLNNEIYVFGGSKNDDESIVGESGPARIYFNDVWKSSDGSSWTQVSDEAPWEPRAGGATVVKDGYIYLLGGEDGFVCSPLPFCDPPYFNDIWRTNDGANWELVTPAADWVKRPGHKCVVVGEDIVCFGGFGLLVNPVDMWASADGASWRLLDDAPWNAFSPLDIKYDFDAIAIKRMPGQRGPAILTAGGDRETFDFGDPTNYLNIDNDVWAYSVAKSGGHGKANDARLTGASPNPFNPSTNITYALTQDQTISLAIYDITGRRIKVLVSGRVPAGQHSIIWDGTNAAGSQVASGTYLYQLQGEGFVETRQVVLMK